MFLLFFLSFLSRTLCQDAFWSSLLKSPSLGAVVNSCLKLACNDALPRIRHGAGIYQGTEQRNLDESDMCKHASVSIEFFFMLIQRSQNAFCSFFIFFLFQPNFLFHYYATERVAVHRRDLQAGQLLGNNSAASNAALFLFFFIILLTAKKTISLTCNYHPGDQIIHVEHQG